VGNYIQLGTAELVALNFPTVVTVSENKNPIANAGPDKTALVKEQINFDGRQSSDSDGYVTAWVWDFGDGSPTATGTLPSHAYAQPGQYTVTLTVTDDKGATAVDQALVLVKAPITAVGDLVADVKNSTSGSIQKSLLSKLNRVLDSLNKKNDGAAINKLMLFIEEVQAQRAKKIPGDVADRLIALANRIIAAVQAGANTFQVSTIDALTRAESSNLSESPGHTVVETPGFAIRLRIEEPGALTVAITDSKGSLVGLVYGQFKKAGDNIVIWNGRDLQGNPCPKGAYSYQALGSFKPNTSGVIIIR
jgi:PKD repeat protein